MAGVTHCQNNFQIQPKGARAARGDHMFRCGAPQIQLGIRCSSMRPRCKGREAQLGEEQGNQSTVQDLIIL